MTRDSNSQRLPRRSWLITTSLGALSVALLSGCDSSTQEKAPLRIFAASSLTDLFTDLARLARSATPPIKLQLSFSGSHTLRHQLEQGARAELFISAHRDHVKRLEELGLIREIRPFADNHLALIVPPDNPAGLSGLSELGRAKRLIVADQNVPLGVYTATLLSRFKPSELHIASRENNARLVRAKVELGEADAAIVYASDAHGSNKVRAIPLPSSVNPRIRYFLGISTGSEQPAAIKAFLTTLQSAPALRLLNQHGFLEPQA